jgi:hypothetical protein
MIQILTCIFKDCKLKLEQSENLMICWFFFQWKWNVTDVVQKTLLMKCSWWLSEHGFRTPPAKPPGGSQTPPDNSLIFSTTQGSFSSGDGSPPMRPLSAGFTSPGSPSHYHSPYSPSMSPFTSSFNTSFDAVGSTFIA